VAPPLPAASRPATHYTPFGASTTVEAYSSVGFAAARILGISFAAPKSCTLGFSALLIGTPRADATAANATPVSARGSLRGRFHGENADSRADIVGTLCCTPKPGLTTYRIRRVALPVPVLLDVPATPR
jgi:hypothetical protein